MNTDEREIILKFSQNRPYGSRFSFILEKSSDFPFEGNCSLLIEDKRIIQLSKLVDDGNKKNQSWLLQVEAFKKASDAEEFTLKLVQGLLWSSIKNKYGLKLLYNSPLPFEINNRSSKGLLSGLSTSIELRSIHSVKNITEPISVILNSNVSIDPRLLVACELFTSSRLESTERAKFIGLISSLEPLCEQKDYEIYDIGEKIKELKSIISKCNYDEKIKNSILGRIDILKKESVSQSIKRTIKEYFPNNEEIIKTIIDAYNTRSKILHEGLVDPDINTKNYKVEEIMRQILEIEVSKRYLNK